MFIEMLVKDAKDNCPTGAISEDAPIAEETVEPVVEENTEE